MSHRLYRYARVKYRAPLLGEDFWTKVLKTLSASGYFQRMHESDNSTILTDQLSMQDKIALKAELFAQQGLVTLLFYPRYSRESWDSTATSIFFGLSKALGIETCASVDTIDFAAVFALSQGEQPVVDRVAGVVSTDLRKFLSEAQHTIPLDSRLMFARRADFDSGIAVLVQPNEEVEGETAFRITLGYPATLLGVGREFESTFSTRLAEFSNLASRFSETVLGLREQAP